MHGFRNFLDAHSRADPVELQKLKSAFEVALVMHVGQKKSDTRASYDTMLQLCIAHYRMAKEIDPTLPKWSRLPEVKDVKATHKRALRTVGAVGEIADVELQGRGFDVGVNIVNKDKVVHVIVSLGEDPKHVLIQKDDEDAFQISRIQLINQYTVQKEVVVKVTYFLSLDLGPCAP